MLSISQKADILSRAGIAASAAPPHDSPAWPAWASEVEAQFVAYTAARAARSLREAEVHRQADLLRRMAWSGAHL